MLIFFCVATISFALPLDKKEKVFISADHGFYNYKTGIGTYQGHVKVDQGATHLLADRITTKTNNQHKIKEAIAYGFKQPAHYFTLPKIGSPEFHANAKVIKYYPILTKIILLQNVMVTQGDNHFYGQQVLYNMQDETILMPPTKNGRAVLIYNPDE